MDSIGCAISIKKYRFERNVSLHFAPNFTLNHTSTSTPTQDLSKKAKSYPTETTHLQGEKSFWETFGLLQYIYPFIFQYLNISFWKTFIFLEKFSCFILVNSIKNSTFVVVFREDVPKTQN